MMASTMTAASRGFWCRMTAATSTSPTTSFSKFFESFIRPPTNHNDSSDNTKNTQSGFLELPFFFFIPVASNRLFLNSYCHCLIEFRRLLDGGWNFFCHSYSILSFS